MKCLWDHCEKDIDDINSHIEDHISELQEFYCKWEDCQKKNQMMTKQSLLSHIRSHYVPKQFKCSKCEKKFARLDALNKHLKRHEACDLEIQQLYDKACYCGDLRDIEELKTIEMLRDRQTEMNCHRILHQFLDDSKETTNWNEYL